MYTKPYLIGLLALAAIAAHAQQIARIVHYHANDMSPFAPRCTTPH